MTSGTLPFTEAMQRLDALPQDSPILLATHFHPDGDAIGSLLGMGLALQERGKRVVMVVDGGVPDFLQFVGGSDQVLPRVPPAEGAEPQFQVMISLDSSDEERTGDAGVIGRKRSAFVINVDHHATNTGFGDLQLVNAAAVSATEVVWEWLRAIGHPLSAQVAIPLLVGLVTDTLGFRVSSVTPHTLEIAQSLMAAGAPLGDIIARTLNSTPYSTIAIWREALQHVSLEDGVIWVTLERARFQDENLLDATDGGLIGFLNTINEAKAAVSFRDTSDGQIKVGFRSKPGVDVGAVALQLGGGGHKQASGVTLAGTMEAVCAQVLPLVKAAVNGTDAAAMQ